MQGKEDTYSRFAKKGRLGCMYKVCSRSESVKDLAHEVEALRSKEGFSDIASFKHDAIVE